MGIPDHDGRPLTDERRREMGQMLREIDRVYPGSPYRRAMRLRIARNFGDEVQEAVELGGLLGEAADHHELTPRAMDRLTMPALMRLTRRRLGRN